MAVLTWSESYAVGIREIDQQHKRLIQMINDLHDALVAERGQQALSQIVDRMADYTVYHFATEESLLKDHGYPQYGAHKHEHEAFTAKTRDLKNRLAGKRFVLTLEVIHFLRDWLSDHILVNDKKYALFLANAGVR